VHIGNLLAKVGMLLSGQLNSLMLFQLLSCLLGEVVDELRAVAGAGVGLGLVGRECIEMRPRSGGK